MFQIVPHFYLFVLLVLYHILRLLSSIASIFPRLAIPPILNFDYQCIVWQLHEMTGGPIRKSYIGGFVARCGVLWRVMVFCGTKKAPRS